MKTPFFALFRNTCLVRVKPKSARPAGRLRRPCRPPARVPIRSPHTRVSGYVRTSGLTGAARLRRGTPELVKPVGHGLYGRAVAFGRMSSPYHPATPLRTRARSLHRLAGPPIFRHRPPSAVFRCPTPRLWQLPKPLSTGNGASLADRSSGPSRTHRRAHRPKRRLRCYLRTISKRSCAILSAHHWCIQ